LAAQFCKFCAMPIHLGQLIREKARSKKYSQQYLGQLINRSKQNVGDIYKRQSIDSELLLKLSEVLEFDFFSVYYGEEIPGNMRNKEIDQLREKIEALQSSLSQKDELISNLRIALEANQKTIMLLEEERVEYKKNLKALQQHPK
jgi:transcriptional regulator with XRE-family HTH domain